MTAMPDLSAGACTAHHPSVMQPEPAWRDGVTYAKRVCLGGIALPPCPVLAACRDWVLNAPEQQTGVWGGLSEYERSNLRKARTA